MSDDKTTDQGRKYEGRTGGKFTTGNPGKPRGARHKVTLAVETLMEGEADKLARKAIDMALAGDATAMRLCLERIAPIRKGRAVNVALPEVETCRDVLKALQALTSAVAGGEITPDEAVTISALLEVKRKTIETVELEARLAKLEEKTK